MRHMPTWNSWRAMKARCNDPKNDSYSGYGGKGIGYDPAWETYAVFLFDMGERPEGKTLDRRDGKKGYCRENCKWSTIYEQNQNTSVRKHSKTKCKNVSWSSNAAMSAGGFWRVQKVRNGKQIKLYNGPDFFEACCRALSPHPPPPRIL